MPPIKTQFRYPEGAEMSEKIIAAALIYLIFSFGAASLDITTWSFLRRDTAAFLFAGISIYIFLANVLFPEKK